jgi:PAP2 superfamily protein
MRKLLTITAIALAVSGATTDSARADEVTDWNQTLFRSIIIAGTSPLNTTRVNALVQAAVFDAVNGIDRRYTPIRVAPNAPAGASRRAAAVQAAYVMLGKHYGTGGLFTTTQQGVLDARRLVALTVIAADDSAQAITDGVNWGTFVANEIWNWRSNDGFNLNPPIYAGGTAIGQWRPTPNAPGAGTSSFGVGYPQFVGMTPWVIGSDSAFPLPGPPALTSARYLADFNEVKAMGSRTSTLRTPDQTIYSLFWNSSTTNGLWNRVAIALIDARNRDRKDTAPRNQNNTLLENARLLAAMALAMADAGIGCFTEKYQFTFWRPITAIREDDGIAATVQDSTWMPLFSTPGHPEYPSGHSCVSGAAGAVLGREFGDTIPFTVDSDTMIGVTRQFHGVSEVLAEIRNARIFAGIHFRTATEDGMTLGAAVAENVLKNAFQRVD